MKKILLLSFVLIAGTALSANAQKQGQPRIDSLLTRIPPAAEDTGKVDLLNDLCFTYYSINPNEGLKYGKEGLALAEKLNWKKGIASAERAIAVNYAAKSDYPKALEYFFKALKIFEESGDRSLAARVLGNIGNIYTSQNDFPKALEYFFMALKMQEEMGNKNGMAGLLNNIGLVYLNQSDFPKALDYYFKALKINEEAENKEWIALNLGNIGNAYSDQSDYPRALEYGMKALKMYESLGDKSGIARNLGNIGTTYLTLVKDTNKVRAGKLFGGNKTIALQQAKVYTDSAIVIEEEIGALRELFVNYKQLSDIQALQGDHKAALQSYMKFTAIKDSVFNMEKDKKLTQTAMQYDFDKKEAALKAQQEKKDIRQRIIRNSFIGGSVLFLLLLLVVYSRYRFKQKANKKLAAAYENLKSTQQQLVKSEKMAAFGVMASRVAHEIENPLNFVNNFSELSKELVKEVVSDNPEEVKKEAARALINNLQKINEHGQRADNIIKELQAHTRAGTSHEFFEGEKTK
jgi:two-component system, NtrC family, sensor kinase